MTGTPTALLAALATGLALVGCLGSDEPESTRVTGSEATVMASLPEDGVSAAAAAAVEAGARLALADAGGRAGELPIRLVVRSSTEPGEFVWDPDLVSANAERAADDASTIAYLGELDYGASAVSLPITNEARILQVSPTDGLTSLTRTPPGRPRSNPVRLRPAERRSFVRLTPTDLLQAERLLGLMRADGARRIAVLFDQEVYGRELAAQLIARARRDGPEPVGDEEYRGDVKEIPGIARNLAEGVPTRWSTRAWPARAPGGCSPRSTRGCPACPSTGPADCSRATRVCRSRPRRPRARARLRAARRRARPGRAPCRGAGRGAARPRQGATRGGLRLRGHAARARRGGRGRS